jgi:hypothetical protein
MMGASAIRVCPLLFPVLGCSPRSCAMRRAACARLATPLLRPALVSFFGKKGFQLIAERFRNQPNTARGREGGDLR